MTRQYNNIVHIRPRTNSLLGRSYWRIFHLTLDGGREKNEKKKHCEDGLFSMRSTDDVREFIKTNWISFIQLLSRRYTTTNCAENHQHPCQMDIIMTKILPHIMEKFLRKMLRVKNYIKYFIVNPAGQIYFMILSWRTCCVTTIFHKISLRLHLVCMFISIVQ